MLLYTYVFSLMEVFGIIIEKLELKYNALILACTLFKNTHRKLNFS